LYGNLCYHFIKNGEFEKGYQLSKKLIDSGLKNESILYVYGLSAINLKKYNEAENSFLEILRLDRLNYEVLTELADLYFTKVNVEKAKKFLYESLNICKTYPKTYYLLSKIYMIENDIEKVENCVDILIQLVPYDFYPYFLKGVILKQKKEFEKAYENFNKAYSILKNKNDYNSLLNLGILYREMGKIDEALKLFSRLINMFSDNIDLMNEIGICYAVKGEKEKAKVIWEKILKKNPDYLPAKENLKRLGF
jgi:tetratricopeptide (TPR) repeat protein